jgi:hypothetical protein
MWDLWRTKVALGQDYLQAFGCPLATAFHECCILNLSSITSAK